MVETMTAAARVFAIPELLDLILLDLPPRDALLAQYINTEARDTFRGSAKLQRLLFFRLSNVTKTSGIDRDANNSLAVNHLGITTLDSSSTDQIDAIGCFSRGRLRLHATDPDELQDILGTDTASWHDMYLRRQPQPITISVVNESENIDETRKFSARAEVALRTPRLRTVLQAAIRLYAVAEEHEEDVRYWIERDDSAGARPRPKWRKWFGDDIVDLRVDKSTVSILGR